MKIYNASGSLIKFPLNPSNSNSQRIEVANNAPSCNIMPSNEFLSMMVSIFSPEQIALIVSGPFEINMCANIPVTAAYVVQSLDEAIARFKIPEVKTVATELENEEKKDENESVAPVSSDEVPAEKTVSEDRVEADTEAAPVKKAVKKRSSKKAE